MTLSKKGHCNQEDQEGVGSRSLRVRKYCQVPALDLYFPLHLSAFFRVFALFFPIAEEVGARESRVGKGRGGRSPSSLCHLSMVTPEGRDHFSLPEASLPVAAVSARKAHPLDIPMADS